MRKCLVLLSVLLFSLDVYAYSDNTITLSESSNFELIEPVCDEPIKYNHSGGSGKTLGMMKDVWDSILAPSVSDSDEVFDKFKRYVTGESSIENLLAESAVKALFDDVKSSVKDYLADGLSELLDNMSALRDSYQKLPSGLSVYKPNIYLYSDCDIKFNIEFINSDLLLVSDPYYENSWDIELKDNKLIVDGSDDYRFLFYESSCDIGWLRKDSGFIVSTEKRDEQFREILTKYGFNDVEIYDFIEYWDEKLDNKVYVMYPQPTEIVDKLMPLKVNNVTFDNYTRLWFAFEEYNGEDIDKPVIEHVLHDKTSLVEWGGLVIP